MGIHHFRRTSHCSYSQQLHKLSISSLWMAPQSYYRDDYLFWSSNLAKYRSVFHHKEKQSDLSGKYVYRIHARGLTTAASYPTYECGQSISVYQTGYVFLCNRIYVLRAYKTLSSAWRQLMDDCLMGRL